jgi:uncharacterized protein
MVDAKAINKKVISDIVARTSFNEELLVKDYYITLLLFLLKDVEGIYFKGGTALNKTILNYARISEDIDYTLDLPLSKVREKIESIINESGIFGKVTQDKDVDKFVRLIVPYSSEIGTGTIFIDLNERGKLYIKSEKLNINHYYENIPEFSVVCLSVSEMIAEKMAATIGRNKPRDHYDLYQIIKLKFQIDLKLVEKKCKQSGVELDIVKMFDKGQKLHKRWNEDLAPLLISDISFKEVMTTLAKHFKLKYVKEAKRPK